MKKLNQLTIKNFGPIHEARLAFGDLTVFIGSQASGKSLALQLLKLLQAIPLLQGLRLVGGTALALQLGHRKSVDLDL